jgi:predicted nucleic acid-binding protein
VNILLDTNILVRLVTPSQVDYALVRSAVDARLDAGDQVCYLSQNLIEFWNVCTRPRLAAAMIAHGIPQLLTLNDRDFRRFSQITALHPRDVVTA